MSDSKKDEIDERQENISFLRFTKTTKELAEKLGVSTSTISRDKRQIKETGRKFVTSLIGGDYAVFFKITVDKSMKRSDELSDMQRRAKNDKERRAAMREAREEERYFMQILKEGPIADALEKLGEKKDE